MAGNFVANNCRVVPTRLATTALTTVHTATGYTQIIGVRIVNFHAVSTPIVSFQYQPVGSATSYYYQANYTLPVGGALWYDFNAFGAKDGDLIQVQSSIANTTDVFVLLAEVPGRNQ